MAIPVTTRSGKGSPLSQAEMDTNLTNLARSATETAEGNIEIATQAEVDAGSDMTKAIPPAYLSGGIDTYFSGLTKSLGQTGHYELPGGLIVQWGRKTGVTGNGAATVVTFPRAFPGGCFVVNTTPEGINNGGGDQDFWGVFNITSTDFEIRNEYDSSYTGHWIAIGN